jgi:hypothetical protein
VGLFVEREATLRVIDPRTWGRSSGDHRIWMGTSMLFGASPEGEPVHEGGGDQERAAEEPKVRFRWKTSSLRKVRSS